MTYITVRDDGTNWLAHFEPEPPIKILLDGAEVQYVTEADDEASFVVCLDVDANGDFIVKDDDVATVKRTGAVQIIGQRREVAA